MSVWLGKRVYGQMVFISGSSLANNLLRAQGKKVKGTVTSVKDGTPLPGLNIVAKGTTIATITDVKGKYSIAVPNENVNLVFSYIDYRTKQFAVAGLITFDVMMEEAVKSLDEVVVIGYGSWQKKDIATAISTIGSKDIEGLSVSFAELAMQGEMADVQIVSGGNTLMAHPTIRIRG